MALGWTTKLVKRMQELTKKRGSGGQYERLASSCSKGSTSSFDQVSEADKRPKNLTTRRSNNVQKHCMFGDLPGDVPDGCLAVYVGVQQRRYVISTTFLTHALFKELLTKSEEEFGFSYEGGLNIACEVPLFEHLVWLIISKGPAANTLKWDDVLDSFEGSFHSFERR